MTTLVAIQGAGWSVVGCDSRASDESGRPTDLASHKIIENNGILIAGAGAIRGLNILHFGWVAPRPTIKENLDTFMTRKFIPAMRKVFVDAGYDMKEDGGAAKYDSSFLVSVRGVVYPVYEDYSWDRDTRGLYCIGSGGDIALGALEVLGFSKLKSPEGAEKVIRKSIEAAIKWDIFTAGRIITKIQHSKGG